MVWNTMILSQYVIVRAIIHRPVPQGVRPAMIQHYRSTSTDHGCWGLHPESGPSLYCTVLAYLALRLLGVPPEDPLAARAATWIRACSGGVRAVPSWGKFWLAVAGLSDYRAMAPIPPEAFLMPGQNLAGPLGIAWTAATPVRISGNSSFTTLTKSMSRWASAGWSP